MKKYLVINGVNLNMLGIREPGIYGNSTLDDLENNIRKKADELGVEVDFFQSNFEGEIVEKIHSAMGNYNGIIIIRVHLLIIRMLSEMRSVRLKWM